MYSVCRMVARANVNDECSRAMITSIDDIDECGLLVMKPTKVGNLTNWRRNPLQKRRWGGG